MGTRSALPRVPNTWALAGTAAKIARESAAAVMAGLIGNLRVERNAGTPARRHRTVAKTAKAGQAETCLTRPPDDTRGVMRLLSDFDGVWTNPEAEARAQGELLERTLIAWAAPGQHDAVASWLAEARAAIRREPMRYGWAPRGRLSAFSDEDAFAGH